MLVFDIETGPLPEDTLRDIMPPFEPPPSPGEFDESTVKLGNLKDEAKIADKISAARVAHNIAVTKHEANVAAAEADHWQQFVDEAALSPLTGRILAIGVQLPDGKYIVRHYDGNARYESNLVAFFWRLFNRAIKEREAIVGHNIKRFDLSFLVRRSWLLGIDVPAEVSSIDGRYWHRCFVDTMERWQCGNYREQFAKLNTLAKAFGLSGKLDDGGVSGAEFAKFYWGDADQRQLALDYLQRDVEITAGVAQRMGII